MNFLKRYITDGINSAVRDAIIESDKKREETFYKIEMFRGQCVALGLKKFFEAKSFYISDLDNCMHAARIVPDGELMRMLRPLHCMDWADMSPEFRNEVCKKIITMFGINI